VKVVACAWNPTVANRQMNPMRKEKKLKLFMLKVIIFVELKKNTSKGSEACLS
jgi:hypothetical protein